MQIDVIFQIIILVMSVVIHEVSHGFMAGILGDPTAKMAGRLTLNPLKHIDPVGSIILPALLVITQSPVLFGWAKPVPFNPYNLRGGKWGPALVAVAGPFSNFFIALVFGLILRFGQASGSLSLAFITMSSVIILTNIFLGLFNLVPIPPLDGSKVLFAALPYRWRRVQYVLERYQLIFVLILVFFSGNFLYSGVLYLFHLFTGI